MRKKSIRYSVQVSSNAKWLLELDKGKGCDDCSHPFSSFLLNSFVISSSQGSKPLIQEEQSDRLCE